MKRSSFPLKDAFELDSQTRADDLAKNFVTPPTSARPWVYWFWMNGNITSKGITTDLEAMQRVGIGGVLLMDIKADGSGVPPGPVQFATPAFEGMLKHAIREANRLGMVVDIANGDGWSSGGPWIKPEQSMQTVVSSEKRVSGPAHFVEELPQPPVNEHYYRDVAVLAIPALAGEVLRMADCSPKVTTSAGNLDTGKLLDGNFDTSVSLPRPTVTAPQYIQMEFPQPFRARTLLLSKFMDAVTGELQVSDDGKSYRTVRTFDLLNSFVKTPRQTDSISFEPVVSRFYRVLFTGLNLYTRLNLDVTEVELTDRPALAGLDGQVWESYAAETPVWRGTVGSDDVINRQKIIDLTSQMAADGRLTWEVPAGQWIILRVGHTSTGKHNRVAQTGADGLECDKLNPAAVEAHWNGFMLKLIETVKPLVGKTLVATHTDSYETGFQNWTARFPVEFRRRRGYDLRPFLPVFTGRPVESPEVTERFCRDLRRTIAELWAENYSGRFAALAHRSGLKFSLEPYGGGPFQCLSYGASADLPMVEFWAGSTGFESTATSVGHMYGKKVIGAEAFTAVPENDDWKNDPYSLKALGDFAYCCGVNHFVFHRYVHQPWMNRFPGMTFDSWGIHFERTQTWWEQSRAWLNYLTRCQYLLQQGLMMADVAAFVGEDMPVYASNDYPQIRGSWKVPAGYAFDLCNEDVILHRMSVKDGRLVLPDGMSYRLLLLPENGIMSPSVLRKIRDMVAAGAVAVGPKPVQAPGLQDYPRSDEQVKALANELWGNCDGKTVTQHAFSKGKIFWGDSPAEVLRQINLAPDFVCVKPQTAISAPDFSYLHRHLADAEVYFVANPAGVDATFPCRFRVGGRQPELWYPDTGRRVRPAVYSQTDGSTTLPLHLDPRGSVFVVFRSPAAPANKWVVTVSKDGQAVLGVKNPVDAEPPADNHKHVKDNFTMELWVLPEGEISLPPEASTGISGINALRNDAIYPAPGHELYGDSSHVGSGVSVGTNGICVYEHGAGLLTPTLVYSATLNKWTHVVVAYKQGVPYLYLDGKRVHQGIKSNRIVHPSLDISHNRPVIPFKGGLRGLHLFDRTLDDAEVTALDGSLPPTPLNEAVPPIEVLCSVDGSLEVQVNQAGNYELTMANGRKRQFQIAVLPAVEVSGPWELRFPPNWGAPAKVMLDRLISWTESSDAGVKYFSGTASYRKPLDIPRKMVGNGKRIMLDLGRVKNIAQVILNGKELGILWKEPFRVDLTSAARVGRNELEIRITNLWSNRMIGDEQLPEDHKPLTAYPNTGWPDWLLAGKPSPTGRFTFSTYNPFTKSSPLLESGLLGPVSLQAAVQFQVNSQ